MCKLFLACLLVCVMPLTSSYALSHVRLTQHAAPFSSAELDIVRAHLLENIATENKPVIKDDGGHVIHSIPGAVLASPSNRGPRFGQDYQFHWIRDAAITMQAVVSMYAQASTEGKRLLKPYLLNYVNFEHKVQSQPSRPGEDTFGQPKFNIDGTVWDGPWGRPQNDGSALRAITMMQIAQLLLAEGDEQFVRDVMQPMITSDLAYTVYHWQESHFDLWEEVNDVDHFFTKMVQRKALMLGADYLRLMGNQTFADTCLNVSRQLSDSINRHWNDVRGYYSETIYQQHNKGGGMDSAILLGVLLGEVGENDDAFSVSNDRVISSVFYLRNAFAVLYSINLDHPDAPPLLGRYPSDVYDGDQSIYGNPWVLTTNALAEYYYRLAGAYLKQGKITITKPTLLLFRQIQPQLATKEETILALDEPAKFYAIVNALIQEGDHLIALIKQYSVCYNEYSCYHLSEQIDRASGKQVSASDLTWSYASLLAASHSRDELLKQIIIH